MLSAESASVASRQSDLSWIRCPRISRLNSDMSCLVYAEARPVAMTCLDVLEMLTLAPRDYSNIKARPRLVSAAALI